MTTKEMKELVSLARCYERGELLMEKAAALSEHLSDLEKMGADTLYLKQKEKELQRTLSRARTLTEQAYEAHRKLEEIMGNIRDEYVYRLLSAHYLSGRSWEKIARSVGGGNTADAVRKTAVRYLAKLN